MFGEPEPVLVADAKYKRLLNRWPDRPQGVDRSDLYQLTPYLARCSPAGAASGFLLYPRDPEQDERADAERYGPWRTEVDGIVRFERLALGLDDAVLQLRELVEP